MAGFNPDKSRKVIPRWRTFKTTLSLGELGSHTPYKAHQEVTTDFLFSKVIDWQKCRTKFHATGLVGAAITLGREAECIEAARFLLQDDISSSLWMRRLARRALRTPVSADEHQVFPNKQEQSGLQSQIRILRQLLRVEPRDAIIWADLSRTYAILGLNDQAERCMTVALQLAKDNRFILRSAGRLWIHLGDTEKAHDIIFKANSTRYDPWLLAAEVAIADLAGKKPRYVKSGRRLLSDGHVSVAHMSELASALATLELSHGNIKHSRRLFKKSLEKPNENSIAQATWASKHYQTISFDFNRFIGVFNAFEARYLEYYQQQQWEQAVDACRSWRDDQPFSSDPYTHGSYVLLTMLDNYEEGKKIAEEGLAANRLDFTLMNNSAFADISSGNIDEAEKTLSKLEHFIEIPKLSKEKQVTLKATLGLFAFRTGDIKRGRQLYLEAGKMAREGQNKQVLAAVLAYHAIEEVKHSEQDCIPFVSQARKVLSSAPQVTTNPVFDVLKQKLETAVSKHLTGAE